LLVGRAQRGAESIIRIFSSRYAPFIMVVSAVSPCNPHPSQERSLLTSRRRVTHRAPETFQPISRMSLKKPTQRGTRLYANQCCPEFCAVKPSSRRFLRSVETDVPRGINVRGGSLPYTAAPRSEIVDYECTRLTLDRSEGRSHNKRGSESLVQEEFRV